MGSTKMLFIGIVWLCVCILGLARESPNLEITKFTISSYVLPNKTLEMELDIVAPKSPGSYPAILYVTGLEGIAPSFFQQLFIDQIASNGYVYMTVSKLQIPDSYKITNILINVMDWINNNFQQILTKRAYGVVADIDERMILIGHSAAGHVTTQYLNQTCGKVKLQVLLDPVDGADPFGIKNDFITTPGKFLPYATPVLVLSNQLDSKGRRLEPPCAPNNMSNLRFYDAMSGPKWFVNISQYGHVDFFNVQYRDVGRFMCTTCQQNCDYKEYRELVADILMSFFDGIFNQDRSALQRIQKANFTIPTTAKHDYMGYDVTQKGFCHRVSNQFMFEGNLRTKQT